MVTDCKSTHTDMLVKTGFVVLINYKNTEKSWMVEIRKNYYSVWSVLKIYLALFVSSDNNFFSKNCMLNRIRL